MASPRPGWNEDDDLVENAIPTPLEVVVDAALREYRAYRTLQRALSCHAMERRSRRVCTVPHLARVERRDDSAHATPTLDAPRYNHGKRHFLFQSLLHPSLPVRRAAARMILHNHHRVRDRLMREQRGCLTGGRRGEGPGGGDDDDDGLREALIVLLHSLMFGEAPYYRGGARGGSTSMMMTIPRYKNQPDGGDPALQIVGMLTWLVCDGRYLNLVVCDQVRGEQSRIARQQQRHVNDLPAAAIAATHRNDAVATRVVVHHGRAGAVRDAMTNDQREDGVLAMTSLEESSANRGIEFFVARGGLRWACG